MFSHFNIVLSNRNSLGLVFVRSPDSIVKEFFVLVLQQGTCSVDNILIINNFLNCLSFGNKQKLLDLATLPSVGAVPQSPHISVDQGSFVLYICILLTCYCVCICVFCLHFLVFPLQLFPSVLLYPTCNKKPSCRQDSRPYCQKLKGSRDLGHAHFQGNLFARLLGIAHTKPCIKFEVSSSSSYRAMHFSAKRGIAIACRLSVCLSVCNVGEL